MYTGLAIQAGWVLFFITLITSSLVAAGLDATADSGANDTWMLGSYLKVFLTFARNSLVRDMSFRMNFVLQCLSSASWALMNFGLFKIIYQFTDSIGKGTGWGEPEFFVFPGHDLDHQQHHSDLRDGKRYRVQ